MQIESITPNPDIITKVSLPNKGECIIEHYRNPNFEIGAAVAHWGELWSMDDIQRRIREIYQDESLIDKAMGFTHLYRIPEGLTHQQCVDQELAVAEKLVESVLDLNNWKPKDIAGLYLGSTASLVDDDRFGDYGTEVARRSGLRHLSTENDIKNYYMACNSGGEALREAINSNPRLKNRPVIVIAIEGMLRLAPKMDPKKVDAFSIQAFGLAGAAFGIIPQTNISPVKNQQGKSIEVVTTIEDKKRYLGAQTPYNKLMDPQGHQVQTIGNAKMSRMPTPQKEGRVIDMYALRSGYFFATHLVENGMQFLDEYNNSVSEPLLEIIPHHASRGILELANTRFLEKNAIELPPIKWSIPDGNCVAAATLTAFARRLKDFAPGNIAIWSFGAGATYSFYAVELVGKKSFTS